VIFTRKQIYTSVVFVSCAVILVGCGSANEKVKEGILLGANSSDADFVEISDSLEKLAATSDFITEVTVESTESMVYDGSDAIYTEIIPTEMNLVMSMKNW